MVTPLSHPFPTHRSSNTLQAAGGDSSVGDEVKMFQPELRRLKISLFLDLFLNHDKFESLHEHSGIIYSILGEKTFLDTLPWD